MNQPFSIQQYKNGTKISLKPRRNYWVLVAIPAFYLLQILLLSIPGTGFRWADWLEIFSTIPAPLVVLIVLVQIACLVFFGWYWLWTLLGKEELILAEDRVLIKKWMPGWRKKRVVFFGPKPRNKRFHRSSVEATVNENSWMRFDLLTLIQGGRVKLDIEGDIYRMGNSLNTQDAQTLVEQVNALASA
ncbi:MAG TPA: hypothetical protein DCE41_24435 [Cytophagales bacterium]|nr:hypothetical protein [Cytophagales bacterium]HAA18136.1 hypothetical protein [Cytophagales bacterium]HAP64406.1 hypothetical protein [Cytophagales bacterium]